MYGYNIWSGVGCTMKNRTRNGWYNFQKLKAKKITAPCALFSLTLLEKWFGLEQGRFRKNEVIVR